MCYERHNEIAIYGYPQNNNISLYEDKERTEQKYADYVHEVKMK